MSQFGAQTDEELKGGGTASGLQLLAGQGFYDPVAGKYVDRFGDIVNQYKMETLPWRVTSSLVRGAVNSAWNVIFVAQDIGDMANNWVESHLGIKMPQGGLRIPESWRNPAGKSKDKLEHVCEELGDTTFQLLCVLDSAAGAGRGAVGVGEEAGEVIEGGLVEAEEVGSWRAAEAALAKEVGGIRHVRLVTESGGVRFVDSLSSATSHECKWGFVAARSRVMGQIAKDAQLMLEGQIEGAVWHFYKSPVTGRGADPRVLSALRAAGIGIRYH
jgi:hypothetical protein